MISPNVKPSVVYPVLDQISPQAVLAAAGNRTTGWKQVPVDGKWAIVQLLTGALGGGSLQVDLEQATDNSGTGSKALKTNAITNAVDNTSSDAEVDLEANLDYTNGFIFIRAKVTNTGGTGAFFTLAFRSGPAAFMA